MGAIRRREGGGGVSVLEKINADCSARSERDSSYMEVRPGDLGHGGFSRQLQWRLEQMIGMYSGDFA